SNEDAYAQPVNEYLTIYRSMDGDWPVGCKIKGVVRILVIALQKFMGPGVVSHPTMSSFVLGSMAFGQRAEMTEHHVLCELGEATRDIYVDLGAADQMGVKVEENELQPA